MGPLVSLTKEEFGSKKPVCDPLLTQWGDLLFTQSFAIPNIEENRKITIPKSCFDICGTLSQAIEEEFEPKRPVYSFRGDPLLTQPFAIPNIEENKKIAN